MAAIAAKSDTCSALAHVRFVPEADIREMTCVKQKISPMIGNFGPCALGRAGAPVTRRPPVKTNPLSRAALV